MANPDSGSVDPARLLKAARIAEAAGFDGVYVGDHLLHPNPLLESIASLAAIAAVTKRVSLGSCVLLAALREPLWLAKQLGTLDAFAPGRLRVGIGLGGEYPAEFRQAGVPLAKRGDRTEDIVARLRQWMSEEQPDFGDGGMAMGIAPVPRSPPPFLLAGWKEAALRRAARIGDGWIGYLLSPSSFSRRRRFLLDCGAGRDRPFTTGMLLPVLIDSVSANSRARASAAWNRITGNDAAFPENLFVAGSPAEVVEQLHGYRQLGCNEIVLSLVDQGDGYESQLDLLASAILPELRRCTSPVS
jgi:alkanesulfonate monooxygenase SsuD/methylene tetrahydromethanopterin reductase-like flavin-dependent oxidoreductase (luciferase family)